jgi:dipeptidyl-peptidase 4
MKSCLTFAMVLAMTANSLSAADPAEPARPLDASFLRLYAETRGFMLGRPSRPKPTPDGKAVLFLRSEAKKAKLSLYEYNVATGKTKELLTPEAVLKGAEESLSPEEKARRERQRISVGGFTDYQLSDDGKHILLSLSGKLYVFDRDNGKVAELATGKGTLLDPKFNLDGSKVAYVLDHDVYVYDLATNVEKAVTKGGTSVKTHGLAEFVAQEEMGRFSGYWWAPDGQHIAYEEANHEGVEIWYVSDPSKPELAPMPQYYPRPGKKNVAVRLGIIAIDEGETVWVDWNVEKFEYLASVRWDRHGPLTIQVEDRKQQHLRLLRVDPTTGKTALLLEEHDPAFLNLHQDVPRWLPDNKGFLWISDREGKPLVEWHGADGSRQAVIRPRIADVQAVVSVDPSGEHVVMRTYGASPAMTAIFNSPIATRGGGEVVDLTEPGGISDIALSRDHQIGVMTRTTHAQLPVAHVRKLGTPSASMRFGSLPSVALEPGFTPNIELEAPGEGVFAAAIVRPSNFDPKKKYPVIVDVYGGPMHLSVMDAMRPWLLMQWLADQGFIVVAVDNRGTPGRGRAWERAIYQKFDAVPLEDQVAGLKALGAKHPEMDLDRVGITGWSFGGYMSALAVLKRPDVFKAAVAGAPVTDWQDYDSHYTERYMGLLPESQQAYDEANLIKMAPHLKRPLLLVHGTADDNVYFRHTLRLVDALFRAGRPVEVLPLPNLTHMVPDPIVTERLWTRIADQFHKHLGAPKS